MTTFSVPLLLLALQLSLVYNGAHISATAVVEISQSPVSQVVPLGKTAEFYCAASGDGFKCDIHRTSQSIHFTQSGFKSEYGITVMIDEKDGDYVANITIEGRPDNNNTNVSCLVWNKDFTDFAESDVATLIVVVPGLKTKVLFNSEGNPIVTVEIKFPEFCWFESVNYTVVLYEALGGGEIHQLALIEGSVNNPQEPVRETFSAGLVANTNYSVLVSAQTPLCKWNSSTTPHNFNTYFTPKSSPVNATVSPALPAHLLVGIASGAGILLCLLTLSPLTIICFMIVIRNRKKGGAHSNVGDLSSVAYNLTPNPIYSGPLYETISDAVPQSLRLKPNTLPPLPPPLPPSSVGWGEPKYTDSPTAAGHSKLAARVSEYEEPSLPRESEREAEDCYIQMHTSIIIRQ